MNERVSNEQAQRELDVCGEGSIIGRYALDLLDARRERDEASPVLEAARELRCAALRIPKHMTGGEWSDVVLPMSLAGDIVEAIRVYDLAHAVGKGGEDD